MRTIHRNNYDPQLGDYHERIVIDDAREKRWLFDCDGVYNDITQVQVADELGDSPTHAISQRATTEAVTNLQDALMTEVSERQTADRELGEAIDDEATARAEADAAIEQEIQDIKDNPDVVDIVATYADLQNYDTSELGDKDVIRVLADETHEGESSYYRWSTDTSTWTFIGATGPYYTKDEVDALIEDETKANIVFIDLKYNRDTGNFYVDGFYRDAALQEQLTADALAAIFYNKKPMLYCGGDQPTFFRLFAPVSFIYWEDGSQVETSFIYSGENKVNQLIHCSINLGGTVTNNTLNLENTVPFYVNHYAYDNWPDQGVPIYWDEGYTRPAQASDVTAVMKRGVTPVLIISGENDYNVTREILFPVLSYYDRDDVIDDAWFEDLDYYYNVNYGSVNRRLKIPEDPGEKIKIVSTRDSDFTNDMAVFANNHTAGVYKIQNETSSDIALLPKGIEGDSNYQLSLRRYSSIYAVVMRAQGLGSKVFLIGTTKGNYSKVALIEPDASAKIKLWTQVTDNLTTANNDGQKVLSAYQGKVLADRIGDLSALLTTDKTSAVAAINELVGSGGSVSYYSNSELESLWEGGE